MGADWDVDKDMVMEHIAAKEKQRNGSNQLSTDNKNGDDGICVILVHLFSTHVVMSTCILAWIKLNIEPKYA